MSFLIHWQNLSTSIYDGFLTVSRPPIILIYLLILSINGKFV